MDFLKLFLFLPGIHRSNLLMVSSVCSVHPISISYFSFIFSWRPWLRVSWNRSVIFLFSSSHKFVQHVPGSSFIFCKIKFLAKFPDYRKLGTDRLDVPGIVPDLFINGIRNIPAYVFLHPVHILKSHLFVEIRIFKFQIDSPFVPGALCRWS